MHVSASLVASSRLRVVFFGAFLCLACGNALAQTASPDYTNDLPSVERVKTEIKGSDPTDTLARQVAVFTYLQAYIDRIKYNRSYSGPFTPGEQNAKAAYRLAAYQLSQDYAKSHTPAEAAAFERLHGQYEMNSDFYTDWSKRLIGKQSAAAYKGAEAGLGATQKAHIDSSNRANEEAKAQAQAHSTNAQGLSNDPTAVATRRCLELGGSNIACMGKGFMSGFMDMVGFGDKAQESLMGPGRAGVVLSALYKGLPGAGMAFDENLASTTNCGDLTPVGYPYNIEKQGSSIHVLVHNEPKPFTLAMRPDGGFTGPGLISVTGKVIVGHNTTTKTQMVDGRAAMFDECNGPCQTSSSVPIYAPKTERCSVGSLSAPPRRKPEPAQPAGGNSGGGLLGMITETFNTGEMNVNAEDGFRMVGKYSGGGLLLDFTTTSVILDCGQAHIRSTYTIENAPNTFIVHIDNPAGPIALAVQPDNSLRGSGSTTVNGRLVSGMNGDNVTFTPHSETCSVGTFGSQTGSQTASQTASQTGASSSTSVAANTPPAPPVSSPVAAPASAPSAAAPVIPATSTGITLVISSSFPIANNPLAGRVVQLMSERYDIALRKVGGPIAADVTPGRALMAYMANCGPPKSCPAYAAAMHPYFVGKATFDTNGKATVAADLPPGSYYIFTAASGTSGALVWDVPITLKPGDNTITLTATNAELIH